MMHRHAFCAMDYNLLDSQASAEPVCCKECACRVANKRFHSYGKPSTWKAVQWESNCSVWMDGERNIQRETERERERQIDRQPAMRKWSLIVLSYFADGTRKQSRRSYFEYQPKLFPEPFTWPGIVVSTFYELLVQLLS